MFLPQIDTFGSLPDDRLHLEFDEQAGLFSSLCLGLPNLSGMPDGEADCNIDLFELFGSKSPGRNLGTYQGQEGRTQFLFFGHTPAF